MVEPLRHRQTKGAATAMFYLMPPRHISTLRKADTLDTCLMRWRRWTQQADTYSRARSALPLSRYAPSQRFDVKELIKTIEPNFVNRRQRADNS
jgi:hypothetical protein